MSNELEDRIERQERQSHNTPGVAAMAAISAPTPSPPFADSKRELESENFALKSVLTEHMPVSHIAVRNKKIKMSGDGCDKLASIDNAAAKEGSDDDSDVEFLFSLSSEQNETVRNTKSMDYPNDNPEASHVESNDAISPETNNHSPPSYTHASSAYVQNLAEICYTIMNDVRWRTAEYHTLFRWEQGDDLSIVKELSRYYQGSVKIGCGLCRIHKHESSEAKFETHLDPRIDRNEVTPDPDEARAIHLYTRLFYRKGPWFRIDDIYKKYYAPQAKRVTDETDRLICVQAKENKQCGNSPQDTETQHSSKTTRSPTNTSSPPHKHHSEGYKQGVELLIADLCWLVAAGYIRGFESEEECGKTVGRSLLKSDERTFVLSKLGGKAKAKVPRSSGIGTVNEIWSQMQQQKSLWSHFQPKSASKNSLLPVRKHVDEIIFHQVAKCVTESHSTDESTRNFTAQTLGNGTMKHLREALRRFTKAAQIDQISGIACIRLREAPLKTLKRVVRLYLCATEGPGQMRGDGCNGWRSIETKNSLPDLPLSPSIDANWYRISYPGLMVRFGRASAFFLKAFQPVHAEHVCEDHKNREQISCLMVFHSSDSFRKWEAVVELRANVDYLIELNERMRYNERKKERGHRISLPLPSVTDSDVDFIGISDKHVRKNFVLNFLLAYQITDQSAEEALCKIERDLDDSLPMVKLCCERVLHTIGLICLHLLRLRHDSIEEFELDQISQRPWLRHLTSESCLASLLWDIFPYFERNNFYRLALMSLYVLVSGKVDETLTLNIPQNPSPLALHLISRRARGKAFDRIVIDFTHLTRMMTKTKDTKHTSHKETLTLLSGQVTSFTNAVIRDASSSSSISFGSIRTLAKRLRCPLPEVFAESTSFEATELGLRLVNDDCEPSAKTAYRDWSPLTDRSVANAIVSEQSNVGRCSFVGHEDDGAFCPAVSSLNVEELAIECYKSGRLPVKSEDTSISGGGFHGFHDEGGRVRALFRILCSRTVLGMDWGESSFLTESSDFCNHFTVHLSPYQGAPFDLHVGHGTHANNTSFYSRRKDQIGPFLCRLQKLNNQEIADLVYDEVTARVDWSLRNETSDPQLIRDIMQLRTLSALAAGFGGIQLAAIFRCLLFDYRYYSGGLPDLLLFRAIYEDSFLKGSLEFVDLSELLGEAFSRDRQATIAAKVGASFLGCDDEYLGCSKTGDSAGQGVNTSRQGRGSMENTETTDLSKIELSRDILPERLILSHENRKVKIDCMMVEVKSANDRLDPRQEDWLNILDRHGNARVCKFEKSSKGSKTEENVDSKYEE